MPTELHTLQEIRNRIRHGKRSAAAILREIPSYRIGGKRLIAEADFQQWLASKRAEPARDELSRIVDDVVAEILR